MDNQINAKELTGRFDAEEPLRYEDGRSFVKPSVTFSVYRRPDYLRRTDVRVQIVFPIEDFVDTKLLGSDVKKVLEAKLSKALMETAAELTNCAYELEKQ